MKNILIGKVETDPLIHYGGLFNTLECLLFLSFVSYLIFIPFVREKRYRNFLFYISTLMPILNIYYRNNHPFVGGVFLGHLLFIAGILLISTLTITDFERVTAGNNFLSNRKLLLLSIIVVFLIRGVFLFGSRPTDSGIFSGAGAILYFQGSSMFRDYWGVISIGSRYGPMLYLAYLPFVPIAYLTRTLLWGDALTQWNSISDVPLAVATSYTGALFYEGLILFLLIKSFKNFGYYAALFYLLNPINSLILSVNANELPQTAFFILGIYLLKRPLWSSIFFVFSSLMKIYPIILAPIYSLALKKDKMISFLLSLTLLFTAGFIYWLYESSLAPLELRTNPIRDVFLYQKDPGIYHSLWYFTDIILGRNFTYLILFFVVLNILIYAILLFLRERGRSFLTQKITILILALVIILNQSPHPGYYYFIYTLLTYLFFEYQEENRHISTESNQS